MKFLKYGTPISPYKKADNGKGCITPDGYKIIRKNGKSIYEHRYFIEQQLKRKLLRKEHVHHKDGNGLNNKLNNLEVLDIKKHGSIEGVKAKGIPKPTLHKTYEKICITCKKIFKLHSKYDFGIQKYCSYECYWEARRNGLYSKKGSKKRI